MRGAAPSVNTTFLAPPFPDSDTLIVSDYRPEPSGAGAPLGRSAEKHSIVLVPSVKPSIAQPRPLGVYREQTNIHSDACDEPYAQQYETEAGSALKADASVRPSAENERWFTFENSFGEEGHGGRDEIAQRFAAFDKSLTAKGYIRIRHGNSASPTLNL